MHQDVKQRVLALIDTLPDAALDELATFLEYQCHKFGKRAPGEPPYKPVPMGGLWVGTEMSDEDIAEVRSDMWEHFGKREL